MTMTTTNLQILTNHNANAHLPAAARMALSFATMVTEWDKRVRTRRALSKLTAPQLHDIGISVDEARLEARKKMWQF